MIGFFNGEILLFYSNQNLRDGGRVFFYFFLYMCVSHPLDKRKIIHTCNLMHTLFLMPVFLKTYRVMLIIRISHRIPCFRLSSLTYL